MNNKLAEQINWSPHSFRDFKFDETDFFRMFPQCFMKCIEQKDFRDCSHKCITQNLQIQKEIQKEEFLNDILEK